MRDGVQLFRMRCGFVGRVFRWSCRPVGPRKGKMNWVWSGFLGPRPQAVLRCRFAADAICSFQRLGMSHLPACHGHEFFQEGLGGDGLSSQYGINMLDGIFGAQKELGGELVVLEVAA